MPVGDHLDDLRRSSRDYKIRPHHFLPEAEITLWHDANMQFVGTALLEVLLQGLQTHPMVFTRHPDRNLSLIHI